MFNHRLSSLLSLSTISLLLATSYGFAQEGEQESELKIQPSKVVQQPDEKSLVEKASKLIGFRFFSSIKQRSGANLDEVFRGMKAAQDDQDLTSFIAGYEMMKRMKMGGAELNMDQLLAGMKASDGGNELGMSDEEIQMIQQAYSQQMEKRRVEKLKKVAAENLAAGEAHLKAQREKNPNLKELENGMFFEVISTGSGNSPTERDRVKIHYTGRFIDGKVFDSSVNPPDGSPPSPATFGVTEVVPGFSKTLQSMKKGSKWRVYIPGPMAYGVKGRGSIGPNQMLIFEIEMLDIISAEK